MDLQEIVLGAVLIALCDYIWLSKLSHKFVQYPQKLIKNRQIVTFVACWALISFMLVHISEEPDPLLWSGLAGIVIFGVFGAVQYGTNKDWTTQIWMVDTMYGCVCCFIVGLALYLMKG